MLLLTNLEFKFSLVDTRNKACGLDYSNNVARPAYNMAALLAIYTSNKLAADKQHMLPILRRWKSEQTSNKPLMIFINVSAVFTMHCLQELDKRKFECCTAITNS